MLKNPKEFTRVLQKRQLDTLKSFCYFWALDMAPTYAVPGLLHFEALKSFIEALKWFIYNTTAWTDWNCMDLKSKFY